MEFGVVLQTNPPASRTSSSWPSAPSSSASATSGPSTRTCSWQEPFVIYSQILADNAHDQGRPDGHQPGDPRLDCHRVSCSRP